MTAVPTLSEPSRGSTAAPATTEEYDGERPARVLTGAAGVAVAVVAGGLSVYALVAVFRPVPAMQYRLTFLGAVLALLFICYGSGLRMPWRSRGGAPVRQRPTPIDLALAAASVVVCCYPLLDIDAFVRRTVHPEVLDVVMGAACVALVLEATRRTIGWILPAICLAFVGYAYYGGYLPVGWSLGHRGHDFDRIVVANYMGTEGLFGVPLDVAATYIVLFTIYGAVLDASGASRFFVDVSLAAFRRSRAAAGRTVTLAGFLLGTVSGSGAATAVSLGTVAWPVLRRAGYRPEPAGGVLAAAGIGAILSPPTLGAAAFVIAEFLNVSYLQVLLYATVPTLLYYLGILLAIEMDARRFGARPAPAPGPSAWALLARFGYHFSSLGAIVLLMALGTSPFRAVVYATALAAALSFLDRRHRLTPRRLTASLVAGARGILPVTVTTAAAGVIVSAVTLTGLGLKSASLIVDTAQRNLLATAVLAAVAVLMLGLAVPVTASFIIAAVVIGPAMLTLGVEAPAAYMFIFYYAVLSEVTPPTALAAMAAAAITGGNSFKTMMTTWRYALPAFLVPFAFVLTPAGGALLGRGGVGEILGASLISAVAVAALAVAAGGWLAGPAGWPERALCGAAAVLLLYIAVPQALGGTALLSAAVVVHLVRRRSGRSPITNPEGTS